MGQIAEGSFSSPKGFDKKEPLAEIIQTALPLLHHSADGLMSCSAREAICLSRGPKLAESLESELRPAFLLGFIRVKFRSTHIRSDGVNEVQLGSLISVTKEKGSELIIRS